MSKSKQTSITEVLDTLINQTMPKLMQVILDEKDVPTEVKAARVGLANTALHHLRLLRAAYD